MREADKFKTTRNSLLFVCLIIIYIITSFSFKMSIFVEWLQSSLVCSFHISVRWYNKILTDWTDWKEFNSDSNLFLNTKSEEIILKPTFWHLTNFLKMRPTTKISISDTPCNQHLRYCSWYWFRAEEVGQRKILGVQRHNGDRNMWQN